MYNTVKYILSPDVMYQKLLSWSADGTKESMFRCFIS